MASYALLQTRDSEDDDEDNASKHFLADHAHPPCTYLTGSSRWADWATFVLSLLVLLTSFSLFITSSGIDAPRDARRLPKPNQYPGLDQVDELAKKRKGPMMIFPGTIVHASKSAPEQVFEPGAHVILSANDSMFYQWRLRPSPHKLCYIDAVVPTAEDGMRTNKTYESTGSVTEIQIWNVTTPIERLDNISWNTRPKRVNLLGTVAFLPEKERKELLELEDGWQLKPPTPIFPCGDKAVYTVEVACEQCTLEFDQMFSNPPLAFDLLQLG